MVTLDSSAVVAVLRDEVVADDVLQVIARAGRVSMGAPTLVELTLVVANLQIKGLDHWLAAAEADVIPFTREHARVAREAYVRFGRGSGSPARLNYGDVMSYAVAKVAGEPLLFIGDDFTHTDIEPAL